MIIASRPTSGTIDGAPHIQTPSPHASLPDVLPGGMDLKPYKRLAEAVIHQALEDAQKRDSKSIDARRFLCSESGVLRFWCQWLNFHPDQVREMARRKGWGG